MKHLIKSILNLLFPFQLKILLFKAWYKTNPKFFLYAKALSHTPLDLYIQRFIPEDFDLPLKFIRNRFGNVEVFIICDFEPGKKVLKKGLKKIDIESLRTLKANPIILFLAFESDIEMYEVWLSIKDLKNVFWYVPMRGLPIARYFHRNKLAWTILKEEYLRFHGKFDLPDFENIIRAIDLTEKIEGDYVEIGVYKGDSAMVALNYMKARNLNRTSYFFDVYKGFTNAVSKKSADAFWADTHTDTSVEHVTLLLKSFPNAHVIINDITSESLPEKITKIAICNIDVDIFEATLCAFQKVAPLIELNGIIICEDQGHTPFLAGAYFAVQEFLSSDAGGKFMPIELQSGQIFLFKIKM